MIQRPIFFSIAEPGVLEEKALLVLESFRKFAGNLSNSEYWIFRARKGEPLADSTLKRLKELGAHYCDEVLNTQWPYYALANKVAVAAYMEAACPSSCDLLVFVDSDMLFLKEPYELLLEEDQQCAISPVGFRGIRQPATSPESLFWKNVYAACGVNAEKVWTLKTTRSHAEIKAYYNSGLVAVRPRRGLFKKWKQSFEVLEKQYRHEIEKHYMLEQSCFTGVLLSELTQEQIKILSMGYNYHISHFLKDRRVKAIDELTVVHYHYFFQNGFPLKFLIISPELLNWLKPRIKKLRDAKNREEIFSLDLQP